MADMTSPPSAARPPISFGAWLGVVLLFLFFGIFVFVLVAATPHGNNYEQKRAQAREKKVNDARNAATQELNSYAWVDKGKGVARIPIDRAMQLTLHDLASKKPEPANPIATPVEATAPAASPPAPAVSPAATPSATPKPKAVCGGRKSTKRATGDTTNPGHGAKRFRPATGRATCGFTSTDARTKPARNISPDSGKIAAVIFANESY
jgi:hypothetical protein